MRRGMFYIELLVTIALAVILLLWLMVWFGNYSQAVQKLSQYYDNRNLLINKIQADEGVVLRNFQGISLKSVSVNGLVLEYFK